MPEGCENRCATSHRCSKIFPVFHFGTHFQICSDNTMKSRRQNRKPDIINSVHYYSEKWTVWMEKRGKNVACHMTRTKIQNRPHRLEKHNNACLNGKRNYAFHETKPRKTRQITDIFDSEVIKTAATIR